MKQSLVQALARMSVLLTIRCFAPRRQDWARAMQSEFEYLDANDADALAWALGCARAGLALALPQIAFAAALLASDTIVVWLDWMSNSDTPALLVITGAATTLAYVRPRRAWVTASAIGFAPLATHVFANVTGWFWPPYQFAPLSPRDYWVLASVFVLASACAWVGAKAANLRQPVAGAGDLELRL